LITGQEEEVSELLIPKTKHRYFVTFAMASFAGKRYILIQTSSDDEKKLVF
jgi:hypothetical protein